MELISSLKTFVRIADLGSFSAVATELGVAPSLISRQLSALEEHLGARLANRSTRAISITEEGRSLIPLARQVLDAAETLQDAVGHRRTVPTGCVRLGVPAALATHVSRHLTGLLTRHDGISIDLMVHEATTHVIESGLDLDVRIGELADSPLMLRRLGTMPTVLVAAPSYLRKHPAPRHPHDLATHECIVHHAWQPDAQWRFTAADDAFAVAVQGRVRTNNADAAHRAALAGWGTALLPLVQVQDELRDGHLVSLLGEFSPQEMPVSVVYPSRRNLPLRTRVVLEFLIDLQWGDRPRTGLRVLQDAARCAALTGQHLAAA